MVAARASAECASMSASRMWISAMRCGSVAVCSSVEQRRALGIGLEHDLDQRLLGARRLLRDLADARVLRQADRAGLGRQLAGDGAEQRGLAGAVAADKPGLRAGRQGQRGMVEQQASGDAERKVVDDQHGAGFCTGRPYRKPDSIASRNGLREARLTDESCKVSGWRAQRRTVSGNLHAKARPSSVRWK